VQRKLDSASTSEDDLSCNPMQLVLLIRMEERDQSIISRLILEHDNSSLGDQILKSEEYIEGEDRKINKFYIHS
jgi:hypothetical protein